MHDHVDAGGAVTHLEIISLNGAGLDRADVDISDNELRLDNALLTLDGVALSAH